MMAGLFLIFTLALIAVSMQKRNWAISLLIAGMILTMVMLWYHATDILQINL